jgi:hypothetical protein
MLNPTEWALQAKAARRWGWLNPPRLLVDAGAILAFVAAILATNLALTSFPNVKLFDLFVFMAGYTLGLRRGIAVAVLAWLVYGNSNPYGLTTMPLLATVMASETVFAAAGALVRRTIPPKSVRVLPSRGSLLFGGAAILCTLVYDGFTNVYTGISWAMLAQSTDYSRWVLVALFNPGALFFTAAHLSSNVLFFTAFAPLLIKGADTLRKGDGR